MPYETDYTNQGFSKVGTRVNRPDGVDKVTGRAKYGADANAAGQLVGRILRSPHAHALITKIDTSKAEKLPGVKAVLTGKDFPDLTGGDRGMMNILENCMARGRALYDGHAVAAVAAIDADTANEALKLIKVTYKQLPHVTDVDEAMKPSAPIIHDWVRTTGVTPAPTTASNVAQRTEFGHGDIDAGFAQADVIIEKSFKTEQTHQGYIEPHACLATLGPDGSGELWVTTQGHFTFRNVCASLLGLDVAKLRVTASEIGGGFGGKTHVWTEPVALQLSRRANRPVKLVMSRDEVFKATGPTSSTSVDVKIGAKRNGKITAASAELRYQSGAFPGMWAMLGAMTSFACYDLKNVKSVGFDVLVNRPKVAAYRAPSAPMAAFAVESVVDMVAAELGMDAVEFRIKNAAKKGTKASYGPVYGPIGIGPTLEAVKNHPHMKRKLGKNQGRGVACGFWFNFGGQTCTDLNIGVDGSVNLTVGTVDVGGHAHRWHSLQRRNLALTTSRFESPLAIPTLWDITIQPKAAEAPSHPVWRPIFAARDAVEVLKQRAAATWGIPVEQVVWEAGEARAKGKQNNNLPPLSLKEIAAKSPRTGGPIAGHNGSGGRRCWGFLRESYV